MAVSDLEAFIKERLGVFDSSLDTTSGSPLDTQVIQPILRRLGTDPFTVDFVQFAQDRLSQEFPDLATKDGDAVMDLLIKPALLLLDPVIRENVRVRNGQSFKDPTLLTTDEADALGANLFANRSTGDTSRGQVRIYFAAPQPASVSPANFVTSKSGLHFLPTTVQSIRSDEMLFNVEASLYYFDINVVASAAGDQYNIGPDEVISIANLTAAVKLTNKRRFRFGTPEETAVEFVGRAEQELSERSLVTQRGIISKITAAFSEVTQVAVVGFNDPEMQRDVLKGGGFGHLLAAGFLLDTEADGENAIYTRRITIDISETVDFTLLIGPTGPVSSTFIVTVYGGFGSVPLIRDMKVKAVVDSRTLDLEDQVLQYSLTGLPWSLRKAELTLSGIPGGILFPNTDDGQLNVPDDEVHIGGTTDMFIRAIDFDTNVLVLDDVVDDQPTLEGKKLETTLTPGEVLLTDYVLGTSYALNDTVYNTFALAAQDGWSLQIMDGPAAGSYRILQVTQVNGFSPSLLLDPVPDNPPGDFRWRLLDVLDIDLAEPKETKIAGNDLTALQNNNIVQTGGGTDFQIYGVGPNDVLRVLNGPNAGDYVVTQVLSPLFQKIQVDRPLPFSVANQKYLIFRRNKEGGLNLPLIRITSIDLLDSTGQSTGTKVPYAKPIDIRSKNFANVAHGIKEDLTDTTLGLVGAKLPTGATVVTLSLLVHSKSSATAAPATTTVTFTGVNPLSAAQIVTQINTAFGRRVSTVIDTDRVAILPFDYLVFVTPGVGGDTAGATIFGANVEYSSADVHSATIDSLTNKWDDVSPTIDPNYDVVEVLDGFQVGFYDSLSVPYTDNTALVSAGAGFLPEINRHVRVGARSLGVARLFFLEPTTIEFGSTAIFSTALDNGSVLKYLPDKTLNYQKVPALPNDPVPKDGQVNVAGLTLTSAGGDFFRQGIHPGDKLKMTFQPVTGTIVLADPVAGLTHQTIILSIDGGIDKTIIFVNDDPNIGSANVTRKGVADQINKLVGQKVCSITGANQLEFEADISVIIRRTGTANVTLGFSTLADTFNDSPVKGTYTVTLVTATVLTVLEPFPGVGTYLRQHFLVVRDGLQRIVSTQMATQTEAAGLFFCDVELISQGTGDVYNIASDLQMTVVGYESDGYWLTTEDSDLTFSSAEKPILHVSRSILEVGVSDSPLNATQISGQNLLINYERSGLTSSVQSFASAEEERVLCESPLVRHLIPYFMRFDTTYFGGSKEDTVIPDIESFIKDLAPQEFFQVSDLEKLILNRGALSIQNPIDLIAVIHNFDRSISVERSQNKINTGRLAAFVPDVLNIKRLTA